MRLVFLGNPAKSMPPPGSSTAQQALFLIRIDWLKSESLRIRRKVSVCLYNIEEAKAKARAEKWKSENDGQCQPCQPSSMSDVRRERSTNKIGKEKTHLLYSSGNGHRCRCWPFGSGQRSFLHDSTRRREACQELQDRTRATHATHNLSKEQGKGEKLEAGHNIDRLISRATSYSCTYRFIISLDGKGQRAADLVTHGRIRELSLALLLHRRSPAEDVASDKARCDFDL